MNTQKFEMILDQWDNGNTSIYWAYVKKLSRKDRAELVKHMRERWDLSTIFMHVDRMISGEF